MVKEQTRIAATPPQNPTHIMLFSGSNPDSTAVHMKVGLPNRCLVEADLLRRLQALLRKLDAEPEAKHYAPFVVKPKQQSS